MEEFKELVEGEEAQFADKQAKAEDEEDDEDDEQGGSEEEEEGDIGKATVLLCKPPWILLLPRPASTQLLPLGQHRLLLEFAAVAV